MKSLNEYDRDEVESVLQLIEKEGWRVISVQDVEVTPSNETHVQVELRK